MDEWLFLFFILCRDFKLPIDMRREIYLFIKYCPNKLCQCYSNDKKCCWCADKRMGYIGYKDGKGLIEIDRDKYYCPHCRINRCESYEDSIKIDAPVYFHHLPVYLKTVRRNNEKELLKTHKLTFLRAMARSYRIRYIYAMRKDDLIAAIVRKKYDG